MILNIIDERSSKLRMAVACEKANSSFFMFSHEQLLLFISEFDCLVGSQTTYIVVGLLIFFILFRDITLSGAFFCYVNAGLHKTTMSKHDKSIISLT